MFTPFIFTVTHHNDQFDAIDHDVDGLNISGQFSHTKYDDHAITGHQFALAPFIAEVMIDDVSFLSHVHNEDIFET